MAGTKVPLLCTFAVAAVPRCTQQASIAQRSLHCPLLPPPRGKAAAFKNPETFGNQGMGFPHMMRAHWAIETIFVWKKIILNNLGT